MDYDPLIKDISRFVTAFFDRNSNPSLLYHNYGHTLNVVNRVKEIGLNYPLSQTEIFVLEAAAWFHDCGQLLSNGQCHEEIGVSLMKKYFQKIELSNEIVSSIEKCIMATQIPHKPTSFLEGIICDADTYNLGTNEFPHTDALLKREYELRGRSTRDWDANTLKFLLQHEYFTEYCKGKLNVTKNENITLVQLRLKD